MQPLVELGALIKNKRIAAGLSQKKFAAICDEHDSTISRIEKGEASGAPILQVLKIGQALNIQPTEICHALGYSDDIRLKNTNQLSDEDIEHVQVFIDYLVYEKRRNGGNPV